jgi:iron complex transport system substrate-binding protein
MKNSRIAIFIASIVIVAIACVVILENSQSSPENEKLEKSDVLLQIYGNANLDERLDQKDIEYIEAIIQGNAKKTEFADANCDGSIDQKDVELVNKIINYEKCELYYINADGKTSSVSIPVKTIVCVYSSYADTLRVLNCTSKVVGVDDYILNQSIYLPEFSRLPSVGSRFTLDAEEILLLNPDIVFTGTAEWYTPNLEEKLSTDATNIDVVRIPADEYSNTCSSILTMGYILGCVNEAIEYQKWHDTIIDQINETVSSHISDDNKTRLFFDRPGQTSAGVGSGFGEVAQMAGAINLASELKGPYPTVDTEWVLKSDPDIIVGIAWDGGYNTDNQSCLIERYNEIIDRYGNIRAIKNGNVYIINCDLFGGPGYVVALAYLATWCYPETFENLNPQELHQEYLEKFCHLNFDVKTQGAFVYEG